MAMVVSFWREVLPCVPTSDASPHLGLAHTLSGKATGCSGKMAVDADEATTALIAAMMAEDQFGDMYADGAFLAPSCAALDDKRLPKSARDESRRASHTLFFEYPESSLAFRARSLRPAWRG